MFKKPHIAAGTRFGRLVTTGELFVSKHGSRRYFCVCDCGATSTPYGKRLLGGDTRSCGCARASRRDTYCVWTPEREQKLIEMADDYSGPELASMFGVSRESIHSKCSNLGIAVRPSLTRGRRTFSAMPTHVRYEDHPRGDSDKHLGRAPQPTYAFSTVGNSSAMCAV